MNVTRCPVDAELSEYLLGELDSVASRDLEQHVDICEHCQKRIEKLNAADVCMSALLTPDVPDHYSKERECESALERIVEYGKTIPLSSSAQTPHLPEQVGPYRILERLGQGGMGTVYKAQHTRLNRIVAFKVLNSSHFQNPSAEARFHREIEAIGALDHDNIVRASDADVRDGVHYLAMDYIEGLDLSQVLKRLGPLRVADACEIIVQAAEGLQYAYERNLVHRDLKPSNLILTNTGVPDSVANMTGIALSGRRNAIVKILDFGLALCQPIHHSGDVLTSTNQVMGTLDYMAPEQATDTHHVDIRADIYALGATLYKLLTGLSPLECRGATSPLNKLLQLTSADSPPVGDYQPNLPGKLVSIIAGLLSRKPEKRPSTPADLARVLRPFSRGANLAALLEQARQRQELPEPSLYAKAQLTAVQVHRTKQHKRRLLQSGMVAIAAISLVALGIRLLNSRTETLEGLPTPKATSLGATNLSASAGTTDRSPDPPVAPFDGAKAATSQRVWAEFLKVPVEFTNPVGMTFRLIPPGEFDMGSPEPEVQEALELLGQTEHWRNNFRSELPQHRVRLTTPYFLGTTAVTQGQFYEIMQQTPAYFSATGAGKEFVLGLDTQRFPVENVDFATVVKFCEALSQRDGIATQPAETAGNAVSLPKGYRLPTEAEWEFACRAGTTTRFWNGDQLQTLNRIAWTSRQIGPRPNEVGLLSPNPFGLYDMHGNIFQMCLDWWSPRYPETKEGEVLTNPLGTIAGTWKVSRGGDWSGSGWVARSGTRAAHGVTISNYYCGFRVALSVEDYLRRKSSSIK